MLNHSLVAPNANSRKTSKRLGRGNGSGKGTFSGKGCKGQNARAGGSKFSPSFEGGQSPLFRRMPKKRGFTSLNKINLAVINVSVLEKLASDGILEINNAVLVEQGLIKKEAEFVKLLGDGELKSKISVTVNKASKQAIEKIEKAGGKVELI
ncbi:MAG: 50S ribosomal protein L15 [Candidatus Gracilibacteria bacterium]|nr:50S ribosomal protein L15 [Candidatus Gracilibacteria bacterium]